MNSLRLLMLLLPITSILAAEPLYIINEDHVKNEKVCKASKDALSCRKIDVDFDLIESMADILIPEVDVELSFQSLTMENEHDKLFSYENDDGKSATLDISKKKVIGENDNKPKKPAYLAASIHVGERVFEIASCRKNRMGGCHVLLEFDPSRFVDGDEVEHSEEEPDVLPGSTRTPTSDAMMNILTPVSDATMDRSTPTIQVKIYYTQDFIDSFADTDTFNAFINLAFSETNTGYSQSGVNLQAELHSTELSSLAENEDTPELLAAFRDSEENYCLIRDGADAAILLTLTGKYCGSAYVNVIHKGQTLGVVKKSCATGYYSFGHEIAHMARAYHNQEKYSSIPDGAFYYGELINTTSGEASGYRTIMAYTASGYGTRINRYSSATNTFNGNPLGTATEDNSRQLNEKAASFAAVGETLTCACQDLGYKGYYCHQYSSKSCDNLWFATSYCPIHCGKC